MKKETEVRCKLEYKPKKQSAFEERVVYTNLDTGASFLANGKSLPSQENSIYRLVGSWSEDGNFFKVSIWGMAREDITDDSIRAFLKESGVTSASIIESIVQTYGADIVDIIRDDSMLLALKYPELGITGVNRIVSGYKRWFGELELYCLLSPFGIRTERVEDIWCQYGAMFLLLCYSNPYHRITYKELGFAACDALSMSAKTKPTIFTRCACAVQEVLNKEQRAGGVCMPYNEVVASTFNVFREIKADVTPDGMKNLIGALIQYGKLISYENMVYLPTLAKIEQELADNFLRIMRGYACKNTQENVESAISSALATIPFRPEERQLSAVRMCLSSGLSIITGGPGTGKSTVLDLFLKAARTLNPDVRVKQLAPSGKAAKRMQECTRLPASTVHKYLGVGADINESTVPSDNPVEPADIIVVDECSMLDIYTCALLMKVVDTGTQVVFVGDVDQLPSVGAGTVLYSMIASNAIPVTKLNVIHRQGAESPIVHNAHLINDMKHGAGDYSNFIWNEDFCLINARTAEETKEIVKEVYLKECNRVGVDNVAVLTPYRRNKAYSSSVLATELQDIINPIVDKSGEKAPTVYAMGRKYRKDDRIMQVKNRGELTNGTIGIVRKAIPYRVSDDGRNHLIVDFGGQETDLYDDALDAIDLAYAYTIHRSQGSEYKTVIIPIFSEKPNWDTFLTSNLIYTGVTRAKERVILVGTAGTLKAACRRETEQRPSMLHVRLAEGKNNK